MHRLKKIMRRAAKCVIVQLTSRIRGARRIAIYDPQGFAAGTPTEVVGEKSTQFTAHGAYVRGTRENATLQ